MIHRLAWIFVCAGLAAQTPNITLKDALERARKYAGQIQSANLNVLLAKEDTFQAKAAKLPTVNALNQFIYTQPNGSSSGVFISNDGVHVYNEQAQVHEELLDAIRQGEVRRAMAAEAVTRAKAEVASRGLNNTVVQDYYAIIGAERHAANQTTSVEEAAHFLDITQKQEKGGEAAHSDVIKAQIDLQQRQRDVVDANLAVQKAKMALGVLIFPDFNADYNVEDDLQQSPALPAKPEAAAQASATNPDLQAAEAELKEAGLEIVVARYQYLPSFGLDFFYGLNSTQFALHITVPGDVPGEEVRRLNVGYAAQATLNIPVWNWGSTRSKVKQAEYKRDQAAIDLATARRTVQSNIAQAHAEADTSQKQVESLRSSLDLAKENLRLTLLRYQAGESTAFEVVDAQNTVTAARNAADDGLVRYRVAVANLQILMGTF